MLKFSYNLDMLKNNFKISNFPQKPGVYEFSNKDGEVIYIGKAKNLRARVRQYFAGTDTRPQIPFLLSEATKISYTVVQSELESLYLENTLIKKHLPKYNIMLRDDKNYAFIKIDYSTQIPQIGYARKIEPLIKSTHTEPKTYNLKPSTYFGPYSSALKIRQTLKLVRKIFPYCANEKISQRPCFYYYLHRCNGACIGKISLEDYQKQLDKIKLFLSGKTFQIKKELLLEMKKLAKAKKFESAARIRDQIKALEILEQKQIAIFAKKVSWDIVSFASLDNYFCINLFKVRDGKLNDKENFLFEMTTELQEKNTTDAYRQEIIQSFLEKYYSESSSLPQEIYTEILPENISILELLLKNRNNKKIKVHEPKKGKPLDLVKLGKTNAEEYLKKYLIDQGKYLDEINRSLTQLKEVLHLDALPKRIECYDISNIQGTNAVGSMVVFENGKPAKSQYRKFKIRGKNTPDDFSMMREMLERRFSHNETDTEHQIPNPKLETNPKSKISRLQSPEAQAGGGHVNLKSKWPTPDLVVIDGGKGQLSAVLPVLKPITYNLKPLPVISLAKRIEEIFIPNKKNPILLSHDQPALKLLQRIRDEAHRFGITFHRKLRSQEAVKSALDEIPGIGPKTKKLLKQNFGTVANIKKASLSELKKVIGKSLAKKIQEEL
jgi:excinuclease ABC subunit C